MYFDLCSQFMVLDTQVCTVVMKLDFVKFTTIFSLHLDCRRGQSLVVWALTEGRQAARQIDFDLMGETFLAGHGGVVGHSV